MGIGDDIKHGAEKVAGKAKETWGDLTDDERLQAEGKQDQVEAEVKDAASDAAQTARNIKDDLTR